MSEWPISSLRDRRIEAANRVLRQWMPPSVQDWIVAEAATAVVDAVMNVDPTEGIKERGDAVIATHAGWQYDAWDNTLHCVGCMWEKSLSDEDEDQYGVIYAPHLRDELMKVGAL